MELQEIMNCLEKMNFTKTFLITTDKIPFEHSFRKYCEENLCGQFNANYSCPPLCGTPEEMEERVHAFKYAIVIEERCFLPDFKNVENVKNIKNSINSKLIEFTKTIKSKVNTSLLIGAGCCTLCTTCKKVTNQPCPHPEIRYSCLSAYCINAKELADMCHMNYQYEEGKISFFGLFLLNI